MTFYEVGYIRDETYCVYFAPTLKDARAVAQWDGVTVETLDRVDVPLDKPNVANLLNQERCKRTVTKTYITEAK